MKSRTLLVSALSIVVAGFVAVAAMPNDQREVCVARLPQTAGLNVGFELIDLFRREAWVTTDWTIEEFAKFSPGISSPLWLKNDPREGFAAQATILRSPGCTENGQYTYQTMFGRTFFHIADVTGPHDGGVTDGALTESGVEKYHVLTFDAGQTVSFLLSPAGGHFVRVNQPVGTTSDKQELPEGWSFYDLRLQSAWQADLSGKVHVLRLDNGVSFQGPITDMPLDAQPAQTGLTDVGGL